ncbi:FtsX-like permease family protein [Thiocystis violascens]|uniref:ABC-type transport system, involved in lipoprotein release, permease component n=1 Tax=Thiocystis violascens (strain ATCC 17096 / DSM 198 / 6111) TaxID=765911 RepID=I3YE77_THIV6|nr:FtsX-like permease family protein [Thiocystis violascens]AFL75295.1 ABC-type transport system, involved in lipoprotein release, permease component [Thiocystis violascens DSM 198]
MHATREILRLAYRDFAHERRISLCYVLALTAVLAPLLILFGLKFGLVDTLAQRLVQSPANREIGAVGSDRFDSAWFERMTARTDVAFVIPNTRRIAASLSRLQNLKTGSELRALQMIPSGPRDPLLGPHFKPPDGLAELVLSVSAAGKLGVAAGERLLARIDRSHGGRDEGVVWEVMVTGVLSPDIMSEEAALVSLPLLVATEDYRDGVAVPALGWAGTAPPQVARSFARFRLYAASIDDVARLESDLSAEGIAVRSQLAEIASMQTLDRNLSRVFWLIAFIGTLGFLASLAANLLANVERKWRELSILRLIGFPTASLILFPVAQAALVAALGAIAAVLVYLPVSSILNGWFVLSLQPGESICRLLPIHVALALVTTLFGAAAAAAWAGWRAARIEPAEGIRDV